eukprot:GGOE01043485.1.p1 GENE.GGOE01043485.1~~GGOE01043485.1.p1  ORF type:complete len:630 (-),score=177.13 GGOE01043485.1:270-2159(-)
MSGATAGSGGYSVPPWLKKDPWTGVGKEALWGFSPAIDLLDVVPPEAMETEETITLLLTGASDCRHILKTLARARRHTNKSIHFIIHEPNLRTYARHLMFFLFLLELSDTDDLDEKVFQLLELLGNGKLRVDTNTWLRSAAQKIARFVTNNEGLLAAAVDCSQMKSRERDWIEEQLGWWKSDKVSFDIDKAWDNRMRVDLAERYDSRRNMIDWDYHMGLGDLGPLVKFPEYRAFRNDAIAYDKDLIDPAKGSHSRYEHVNRSMLHFDRKGRAYYAGDIKNGPFACFGVETENKKIVIKQNDGYRFGAGVCALHNVRAWLYEFLTGRPWVWLEHVFQWDQTEEKMAAIRKQSAQLNPMQRATPVPFRVSLCTLELETMVRRWAHQQVRMHLGYVGVMAGTYFQPWLLDRLLQRGRIVLETAKFILELNDEQRDAYVAKLQELAASHGWTADTFGQRVLHIAQLQEPKGTKSAPQDEARRRRMEHPNFLVFVRPDASKTAEEMQALEESIAEQERREQEELARLKAERAAAFEASEKKRLAHKKQHEAQGEGGGEPEEEGSAVTEAEAEEEKGVTEPVRNDAGGPSQLGNDSSPAQQNDGEGSVTVAAIPAPSSRVSDEPRSKAAHLEEVD